MVTRSLGAVPAVVLLVGGALLLAEVADPSAVRLRNRGYAELENEKPALAAATFEQLTRIAPKDPLGWANLAIALLRQQDFEPATNALAKALELAPTDPRLLAIQGEIEHWSGRGEAALDSFRRAADGAPDDHELQYALYRQATILTGEQADAAARLALERLARLRPENLVVMLQLGQRARAGGDRAQATAAFLRVRELVWQARPGADKILEKVLAGLEANDLEGVRVPATQLENVLKISPMYRESLRELSTGIQGIPLAALRDEPPVSSFGPAVEVELVARRIAEGNVLDVAVGDLDGDEIPDVVALFGGESPRLRLRPGAHAAEPREHEAAGVERLLVADLDNDGRLDVVGYGPDALVFWRNGEDGLEEKTQEASLGGGGGVAATVIDFDIEGDLDLFTAGSGTIELYRNVPPEPLQAVGARSLPDSGELPEAAAGIRDVVATDLDRDGDLDLVVAGDNGLARFDNLRQGRFTAGVLSGPEGRFSRVVSADFDNDGRPDLATAGRGGGLWRGVRGDGDRFEAFPMAKTLDSAAEMTALAVLDADNDGRLDVALGGPGGIAVAAQRTAGKLSFLTIDGAPAGVRALAAADLDRDGDEDLLAATADGLYRLENRGGNANRWLQVRLRGLDTGNSKNNLLGYGSTLEVRAGSAYQFREAVADVTHFGLGGLESPDLLRVVWTNGVPQNRFDPAANQWIVEEQLLKGSCPFLYVWTGERFEFATDLLWGAPIGLPAGAGRWMGADPSELVEIERIVPLEGRYELRLTEELWEAAFFDAVRLWVVDHPEEVEVASSLRVVPGEPTPERVLGSRGLRPVATAWDAAGRDVTKRVARRDEVYADGWRRSRYQGVATEPWTFTFDLGEAPESAIRLHLDGWIFPTDARLNLAIGQRREIELVMPRLEVETEAGWRPLIAHLGFPAGKTKTMVIDTPPLPAGARKLRIVSTQWLSWDRLAWVPADTGVADEAPRIQAHLDPDVADLRFRGFSRPHRLAPNAPHGFDYDVVTARSPWLPFPGRYTRFGDVRELLAEVDDRSVILAAGDEIALSFDATGLPPVAAGWRRTLFLESHGWDKDADRNTGEGLQVGPLPYRAMRGYPYTTGDAFPDGELYREYREEWLTRIVEQPAPASGG